MYKPFIGFVLFIILLNSCTQKPDKQYVSSIKKWQRQRVESLTNPESWLSLSGLFWLQQGQNSFGGAEDNNIVFPGNNVPPKIGLIILNGDSVYTKIYKKVKVTCNNQTVEYIKMIPDVEKNKTVLRLASLSWFIIKRGDKYAIRLRDSENPAIKNFKGIERFPIDKKWRVKARMEFYNPPKIVEIPTVLGTMVEAESPGALVFEINGREFRLDPLGKKTDKELSLIFSDKTSGWETYGGGRFLEVDNVDSNGYTYIDFNKAYNPPCAFTDYATCPLPPEQNKLKIRVEAGEKKYSGHSH
jgi:uncharacterized protein (DUF1684 family)